jgi:hypothetical protein
MSGEFLGKGVITLVGTRKFTGKQRQAVFLSEYDEDDDSYTGVAFLQSTFFQQYLQAEGKGNFSPLESPIATGAVAVRVSGLRRYPYAKQPDYAFQFVLPREAIDPLREIMQKNADAFQSGVPIGQGPLHEVVLDDAGEQVFDSRDTNKDGIVDKSERRPAKRGKE